MPTAARPRHRKAAPLPYDVELMLCTLVAEPFDDANWIFEPKLDGLRVLCRFDGRSASLISRNGKAQDSQFPDIVEGLEATLTRPALLDGEVVCLDERGRSSFRLLQQRFHLLDAEEVRRRMTEYPCSGRQEFVVGGFTDPQRSRVGLGALLVGYYGDNRKTLAYAGKVGTGYTSDVLLDLRPGVLVRRRRAAARAGRALGPAQAGGRDRVRRVDAERPAPQPRFEGLRMDKKPAQVRRERAKPATTVKRATKKKAVAPAKKTVGKGTRAGDASRVTFSHPDKVWFPDAGVTKGDVIQYYLGVADKLLPHLRDRPITLERMPDGVGEGKPRFWQKNTPDYYPSWVPRVELKNEDGKVVRYALVNDVDTLAYLVNQGAITFHPFLSRTADLDRPDYVLFDLDPGGARFADVVRIARTLHDRLDDAGEAKFVKTSGKSGLHVLVPWRQKAGYDEARAWAMGLATDVVEAMPDIATTERHKAERDGRVYVDVIQNARGHHAVPPYVLRPTPGATVSTPLEWKEVTPKLDPKKFTIASVSKRFAGKPDLLLPLVPADAR